jgi:hypothetical protein
VPRASQSQKRFVPATTAIARYNLREPEAGMAEDLGRRQARPTNTRAAIFIGWLAVVFATRTFATFFAADDFYYLYTYRSIHVPSAIDFFVSRFLSGPLAFAISRELFGLRIRRIMSGRSRCT